MNNEEINIVIFFSSSSVGVSKEAKLINKQNNSDLFKMW